MFVKLVLKLSLYQRSPFSITKLAHDALKELVKINSCKYETLVATPFKCVV